MSRILLTLTFLVWANHAFAQTRKVDSLETVLARHPQVDTFRVNRLNDLFYAVIRVDKWPPDTLTILRCDSLMQEAIRLSKRLSYTYGEAQAHQLIASTRIMLGQQTQYEQHLKQALKLARRSGNKELISQLLRQIGMDQSGQQQRQYFQQAIAVARSSNDINLLFDTHVSVINAYVDYDYPTALQWAIPLLNSTLKGDTNKIHQYKIVSTVAELYTSLKDYDQALHYYQLSQQIARKRHDEMQVGASLTRIGKLYLQKDQPEKAIEAFKRALPSLEGRREDWVVEIQSHLADCYQRKGWYQQAIKYAQRALATMNGSTFKFNYYYPRIRPVAWLALSRAYLQMRRLDSALYYVNLCRPLIGEVPRASELSRDVTKVLAQVYAKKGDYKRAYQYQNQHIAFKDSLNNETVTRKATALRFTDQMNRQHNQIALLRKDRQLQTEESRRQRQLLYTSLVVLALIGGVLALVYRNNRQKEKANALLAQQRDQINQALTELKTTQNQLIQKEKMASLGELTAGIAHEIQNPLNFVNNFSEVSTEMIEELAEESQKPQRDSSLETDLLTDLKANLQKINHHGQRASNIVKGMLEHSRSSTGDVQPTNLNGLADEYLRLAYHGQRRSGDPAKDKEVNCELVTDFDEAIGQVAVMSQEIGRVLLNLFSNAFYAVHQRQKQGEPGYQPAVRIRTRRLAKGVEIRISDNGMGMAQEVQQKIFQPFFTTKPTGEGTGLGLSLSYDIITKGHGGTLAVVSQEGEGTEFIITIPV